MPGRTGELVPVVATSTRSMVWPPNWSALCTATRSRSSAASPVDAVPAVPLCVPGPDRLGPDEPSGAYLSHSALAF